jgi:hypothetical protein
MKSDLTSKSCSFCGKGKDEFDGNVLKPLNKPNVSVIRFRWYLIGEGILGICQRTTDENSGFTADQRLRADA